MPEPIAVNRGQVVSGALSFKANDHFSYDLQLTARLEGCVLGSEGREIGSRSTIYLQDQSYHYLNHPDTSGTVAVAATGGGGGYQQQQQTGVVGMNVEGGGGNSSS